MAEFKKTAEGKKYIREKTAHDRKTKLMAVKSKFLGKGEAKEPKRPPSAYFIFVGDKRSALQGDRFVFGSCLAMSSRIIVLIEIYMLQQT